MTCFFEGYLRFVGATLSGNVNVESCVVACAMKTTMLMSPSLGQFAQMLRVSVCATSTFTVCSEWSQFQFAPQSLSQFGQRLVGLSRRSLQKARVGRQSTARNGRDH